MVGSGRALLSVFDACKAGPTACRNARVDSEVLAGLLVLNGGRKRAALEFLSKVGDTSDSDSVEDKQRVKRNAGGAGAVDDAEDIADSAQVGKTKYARMSAHCVENQERQLIEDQKEVRLFESQKEAKLFESREEAKLIENQKEATLFGKEEVEEATLFGKGEVEEMKLEKMKEQKRAKFFDWGEYENERWKWP